MREEQTLDNPEKMSTTIMPFQLIAVGFLLGSSLSFLEWVIYRVIQDLFIMMELEAITVLWSSNIVTTIIHVIIVFSMFIAIQKKLQRRTINWKKLYDQSKYFFSISILLNAFFLVYWDSMLPDSFFIAVESYNAEVIESLIYSVLPLFFTGIGILIVILLLKRLSTELVNQRNQIQQNKT